MTDRKYGWAERRRLHVIDEKAPMPDEGHDPLPEVDNYDSTCSCRCEWCWSDEHWATGVLPWMTVHIDGLVHFSVPRSTHTVCGIEDYWTGPSFSSTDQVIAYAVKHRGDIRDVTCMACLVGAHFDGIEWVA